MPIEGELTAPDDSLRGELEAAFGGGDEGSTTSSSPDNAGDADQSAVVDQVSSKDEAGKEASSDGRQRGPDGKFVPKTETKEAPVAAADPNSPSTDAAKASTETAQPAAAAPPAGWTAAEKAEWTKLSPAVQAAVSRREAEISRGGQQWSDEKRRYEAVLSPVAEAARRNGMNTEQGLQALLNAQSFLERDPTAAIKWLAQSHGVNLATLAGSPDDVPSAQAPDIEAIVRRAVQQTVHPIVAPIQDRWQQEEHSRQETTTQMVVDFAASPGHEHFNGVEEEIMFCRRLTTGPRLPILPLASPYWRLRKRQQRPSGEKRRPSVPPRRAVLPCLLPALRRGLRDRSQRVHCATKS